MSTINPKYSHTKLGTQLFRLCAKQTKFIVRHQLLYYLLACTQGSILTIIGLLITVVLAIAKIQVPSISFHEYLWNYFIKIGPDYWGGLETGLMFIRDQKSSEELNLHETGHLIQNTLFGPVTPLLITIPSAIRQWYRELTPNKKHKAYDTVQFEDSATECGRYLQTYLMNN